MKHTIDIENCPDAQELKEYLESTEGQKQVECVQQRLGELLLEVQDNELKCDVVILGIIKYAKCLKEYINSKGYDVEFERIEER